MTEVTDPLSEIVGPPLALELRKRFSSLREMAIASVEELAELPGLGKPRARQLLAAFQLAKQLSSESYNEAPMCDDPDKIAALLREPNRLYETEQFQAVFLDTRRRLLDVKVLSSGSLDSVLVDQRTLFAEALKRRASAVILVHNHPSGDPMPSDSDISFTRAIVRAGKVLRIDVLDHIIMGRATPTRPKDYVSLRGLGYFYE